MIKATHNDRDLAVNILAGCFDDNRSVNYIIKQDKYRAARIKNLMRYSFDMCYFFGDVFLSDDKKGCALILLPEAKKTNFRSILLDINLVISCTGLCNLFKAMNREAKIEELHPKELMYYLWFIGVDTREQNKGIGSTLIREVINEGACWERPIYLETSSPENIPWYEKFGFKIYNELDLGYRLFFMRKE